MITELAMLRLLQLVSPGLPIGMYSYSQGLELAIDQRWLNNADDTRDWLQAIMQTSMTQIDLPILCRLYDGWLVGDNQKVSEWSTTLKAHRETAELRAEDKHMGQALARLLTELELTEAKLWQRQPTATLATLFSLAAVRWQIPKQHAVTGYLWSWLENQVLCAVKLVPLGQVAGQRLLTQLAALIPQQVSVALKLNDEDIGGSVFGLSLASCRHEMQYSRLFRS
ncbi:MAG: urease accessory protein UreF [Methylococcaceae bacterium]|jgi:urease accessory protein